MTVLAPAATPGHKPHPRTIGWLGTAALGMGGSNQSLFLISALIIGQGDIPGQGSAAIPLLIAGLLLSYAAAPGWIELVLMSPNRVGGIAASCTAAFRPYSPILSALAGVCYWWGWVPTCGVTALFSATAIGQWFLPQVPVPAIACGLVGLFTAVNLCGIKLTTRLALPIATASAGLAFVSLLAPIFAGRVDWHQATDFHLTTPFPGWFGTATSLMAGLYLIGFGAPAFEAATCHVAETINPNVNVPRAVLANAAMAAVFFAFLPIVWLGVLGAPAVSGDLNQALGPTFAPLLGAGGKSAAIWFMMVNMFHGTIQPLAGAARTLSQLADDGLVPSAFGRRLRSTDVPYVATLLTAVLSILFLLIGDPIWLIAAANFTYLIGIGLPSVAVWLLRRDAPHAHRPWRAPRYTIGLGLAAACIWGLSALFGFQQFGLPTVVIGLLFAYSGAALFALRKIEDRVRAGLPALAPSLHVTLTGAMLLVLALDAVGYIIAVSRMPHDNGALIVALEDIFVAVAILTITVGIVLPGMIAHSADQISAVAKRLASGTLREFSNAMASLGRGDLEGARATLDIVPVAVRSRDELGTMAESFNLLQEEVKTAASGLDRAREGLKAARAQLVDARDAAEAGNRSKAEFLAVISHELRTPLNGVIGMAGLLVDSNLDAQSRRYAETLREAGDHLLQLINDVLDFTKLDAGRLPLETIPFNVEALVQSALELLAPKAHAKGVDMGAFIAPDIPSIVLGDPSRLRQILINLVGNAVKFTERGSVSVEVATLATNSEKLELAFEVRDTGIGIPADRLGALFHEFNQVDSSTSRRFGGTGLGLAISRKLIEGMGGSITAESEFGSGSVFRFWVSLGIGQPRTGEGAAVPRLAGRRVLVVDDNAMNRDIFGRQIESAGGKFACVATPNEGLSALITAAASGRPYDAAVIDYTMPGADGLTLARAIRAQAGLATQRLILATSANLDTDIRADADALFNAVLTKPVPVLDLLRAIMPTAAKPVTTKTPQPDINTAILPTTAHPARHLRILVAEDSATNQAVIRAMLEKLGHRADVVGNGLEAVEAVKALPYDVVLMDVMMPEMDGIEATQVIRALPAPLSLIPILGLTAHVSTDDHASYRLLGMDQVISKPVTMQVLVAAITAATDGHAPPPAVHNGAGLPPLGGASA